MRRRAISIVDIDKMFEKQFERYISEIFKELGYYTKLLNMSKIKKVI